MPTSTGALEVLATLAASGSLAVLLTFLRVPAGALLGAMIASFDGDERKLASVINDLIA